MNLNIKQDRVDIAIIHCDLGVRYFEDGKVDGEHDDNDNPRMPGATKVKIKRNYWDSRTDEEWRWAFDIDPETGIIKDWPQGTTAKAEYKICDDCHIQFLDKEGNVLLDYHDYVPDFLDPYSNGFGDYAIFSIDENGRIVDWKFDQDLLDECIGDD